MTSRTILAAMALSGLSACMPPGLPPESAPLPEASPSRAYTPLDAPPWAAPGTCWAREIVPAVVETVTERIPLPPSQSAAQYAEQTRQVIVRERQALLVQTPCRAQLDPEFIASLQRALTVRGAYDGPVSATLDPATEAAIRRFQAGRGLNSQYLSLDTARELGLAITPI